MDVDSDSTPMRSSCNEKLCIPDIILNEAEEKGTVNSGDNALEAQAYIYTKIFSLCQQVICLFGLFVC